MFKKRFNASSEQLYEESPTKDLNATNPFSVAKSNFYCGLIEISGLPE